MHPIRLLFAALLGLALGCTDGVSTAVERARHSDPEPLCHAVCERVAACEASSEFPGVDACTRGCIDDEQTWSQGCADPFIDMMACELRLSCADLQTLMKADGPDAAAPCAEQSKALQECQDTPFIYFQF